MDHTVEKWHFYLINRRTLIFIVEGASAVSSFVMRSPMPGNIVVPPDSTTFAYLDSQFKCESTSYNGQLI